MGASNELGQGRIFYKLKVEKETNIPLFLKLKKDSNGAWVTEESFNTISGFLKGIELGTYVWEGDTIDTLKFIFDDDANGSAFQVETGINYLSRSILNSLLGADAIGHVKIKVYTSKAKDTASKVYPAAYVEINKQKASWALQYDEQPQVREVKVGGKTLKDDTDLNQFWKDKISSITAKIVSEFEVKEEMAETTTHEEQQSYGKPKYSTAKPEEMPPDDLPF